MVLSRVLRMSAHPVVAVMLPQTPACCWRRRGWTAAAADKSTDSGSKLGQLTCGDLSAPRKHASGANVDQCSTWPAKQGSSCARRCWRCWRKGRPPRASGPTSRTRPPTPASRPPPHPWPRDPSLGSGPPLRSQTSLTKASQQHLVSCLVIHVSQQHGWIPCRPCLKSQGCSQQHCHAEHRAHTDGVVLPPWLTGCMPCVLLANGMLCHVAVW